MSPIDAVVGQVFPYNRRRIDAYCRYAGTYRLFDVTRRSLEGTAKLANLAYPSSGSTGFRTDHKLADFAIQAPSYVPTLAARRAQYELGRCTSTRAPGACAEVFRTPHFFLSLRCPSIDPELGSGEQKQPLLLPGLRERGRKEHALESSLTDCRLHGGRGDSTARQMLALRNSRCGNPLMR